MKRAAFSGSALVMLVAAAAALFALSLMLDGRQSSGVSGGDKARPGTFSTSAVGYAGLYAALEKTGWRVGRLTGDIPAGPRGRTVIVVAEPDMNRAASREALTADRGATTILVLPKWEVKADPSRSAWIYSAKSAKSDNAVRMLQLAHRGGRIVHQAWPGHWAVNQLGKTPGGDGTVQLIRSDAIQPIVGTPDGILVGEASGRSGRLIILSDPDIMANHGIVKGDNAEFMAALFAFAAGGEQAGTRFLFDETVHGFRASTASPLRLLFGFPYGVLTALAGVAAVVAVLAGVSRFGPALRPRRGIEFGKQRLIENSARLMEHTGHQTAVLRRYIDMETQSVAASLHAPGGMDRRERARWLDRIGRSRKVAVSCETIMDEADRPPAGGADAEAHLLRLARIIHHWKGEMLDGSGRTRAHGPGHQG